MNSKFQGGVFRWPVYFDKESEICLASKNYEDNHVLVLCHHKAQEEDRRTKLFRQTNLSTVNFTFKQLTLENVASETWSIHDSLSRAAYTNIIWATCSTKNCTSCYLANTIKEKYIQEEIINNKREKNIENRIFRIKRIFSNSEKNFATLHIL